MADPATEPAAAAPAESQLEQPLFTTSFRYTPDKQRRAARRFALLTLRSPRFLAVHAFFVVFLVLVGGVLAPALAVAYLPLVLAGPPLAVWWSAKRSLAKQVAVTGDTLAYCFYADRLSVTRPKLTSTTNYELFDHFFAVRDGFFLRNVHRVHTWLPAEAVSAELAGFLRQKVGPPSSA